MIHTTDLLGYHWSPRQRLQYGGSNYDSLFVRTSRFRPSSLLDKEVMAPCELVPHVNFDQWSGEMAVGPVGWWRSMHDRAPRVPACMTNPRAKLESDRY